MDEQLKTEIRQLIEESRNLDSIEIGNSKTGVFKVYFNVDDFNAAKRKVSSMRTLLDIAKEGIL